METATVDAAPASGRGRLSDAEARYMQGSAEPATSSVLISNSRYLNNPYYRDAYAQQALRRHGHDLPATYMVPLMIRAINEETDYAEIARLIEAEKARKPDFAAWLAERRLTSYSIDMLKHHAQGTLGATIRAFMEQPGMELEFMRKGEVVRTDLEYLGKRQTQLHDIQHMATGFGPDTAGEQALALANITATARYFTPALAQFISAHQVWVSSTGYNRTALHYHHVMPTYLDAMQQGIAMGMAIPKPLFMIQWEDYLDWQLDDIAADLGIVRGPGPAWGWTTDGASG
jgi:ubiquinone biosynthesis protein Coq4